ncbi:MAG: hypothetical protein L0154_13165 [Chloroflexi bacterium]|nr:hypothetical protein [Chloroflexota bacterium]
MAELSSERELCTVNWQDDTNTTTHRFSGENAAENRQIYARFQGGSIYRALSATGWRLTRSQPHKEGRTDYYERPTGTGTAPGSLLGLFIMLAEMGWLILLILVILLIVVYSVATR